MSLRALLATCLVIAGLPVAAVSGPCAGIARAQGLHRAGLVVQFSEQRIDEFCVRFAEDEVSAFELLRRTGHDVSIQDFGAGSIAVCRIDGVGCAHPKRPCFCECESTNGPCAFWGIYVLDASTWRFAQRGAAETAARDGEVLGFRWGSHGEQGAQPPRGSDLDGVCARGTMIAARGAESSPRPSPLPAIALVALVVAGLLVLSLRARRSTG